MKNSLAPLLILTTSLLASSSLLSQGFFERREIMVGCGWKSGPPILEDFTQRGSYRDPRWRVKMLDQFPQADVDQDGELSEMEAIQYHLSKVRRFTPQGEELSMMPQGVRHWTEWVPMRDGVLLPVEVFLPDEDKPGPVVLIRTSRGRIDSALDYGNELLRMGYTVVGADLTPAGDFINADVLGRLEEEQLLSREERAAFNSQRSDRSPQEDGTDTIQWISRQDWCDGWIGLTGYSEAANLAKSALAGNAKELGFIVTAIGTSIPEVNRNISGEGGAIDWESGTWPMLPESWQAPTQASGTSSGPVMSMASIPDVLYNDRTGWFDFSVSGSLREWQAMREGGRATLIVGVGGHGSSNLMARMPPNFGDCDLLFPESEIFSQVRDTRAVDRNGSRMYYFLMGDATDPEAPGNIWKVTDKWPVTETFQEWYLHADGSLARSPGTTGSLSFKYDPNEPVQTAGGNRTPSPVHGPRDQRHLDSRPDVVLFTSTPLEEPIEFTGEAEVVLFISTDVADTAFIVQLLDIYPDGYKWPIRDGQVITRFREADSGRIEPMIPGQVYSLKIKLPASALALNKGHRLGLQVMSSSFPAYTIHPNTWDSISSYTEAIEAHQTIHLSATHPSRIILPVVEDGSSKTYQPK